MSDAHNPDLNPARTPSVAWRVYACDVCGAETTAQTNHIGRIYNTRCTGSCRTITNPHTARERVGPGYTAHHFVCEVAP